MADGIIKQIQLPNGNIYDVDGISTSIPTADETAAFDGSAHMNSTNMTSQQVDDFINSLDISSPDFGGIVNAYPISGATPLTSAWLSNTSGGTALTPATNKIYILMANSGDYKTNTMFRWGGTAYEPLTSDDPFKVDKTTPQLTIDTTAAAGTDDGDLYGAISSLGWTDVISSGLANLKKLLGKILNGFVKKSGDTMSGTLSWIGTNDKAFSVKKTLTDTNVDIGWDWDNGDGAGMAFRNSDATAPGQFVLYARKDTTAEYALKGSTDGSLTWRGKTGFNIDGDITYTGTHATYPMIRFKDGPDEYGHGIIVGNGGLTIIGAGESPTYIYDGLISESYSAGSELLALSSDWDIKFYTNCQDGIQDAKMILFSSVGDVITAHGFASPNSSYREVWTDTLASDAKQYNSSLTSSSSDSDWLQAYIKAICAKYPNHQMCVFKSAFSPNSAGWFEVCIYNTSTLQNGLPQYCFGTYRKWSTSFGIFQTANYVWSFNNK